MKLIKWLLKSPVIRFSLVGGVCTIVDFSTIQTVMVLTKQARFMH